MPALDALGVLELDFPTSYKWALSLFGGPGREWSYYHRRAPGRRSSDTERRASGVDTPGAEREKGDNYLTSQISRINPDRCRRRSPSHPRTHLHSPGINASQFSNPIFHGSSVHVHFPIPLKHAVPFLCFYLGKSDLICHHTNLGTMT